MRYSFLKRSGKARVNEESPATHTFIHEWNGLYLAFTPSRRA